VVTHHLVYIREEHRRGTNVRGKMGVVYDDARGPISFRHDEGVREKGSAAGLKGGDDADLQKRINVTGDSILLGGRKKNRAANGRAEAAGRRPAEEPATVLACGKKILREPEKIGMHRRVRADLVG
jgi:hypothetical protein